MSDVKLLKMRATEKRAKAMADWCRDYKDNPRVQEWLEKNPPPKGWQGTALEYSFTEMPIWVLWA